MYDSTSFWVPPENANYNYMQSIPYLLKKPTEHIKADGFVNISGYLGENLRINLSCSGITCQGSLAKYFLSDNFQTLTRSDTARAIEKLSDELGISIKDSKVNRIDVAQNMLMRYNPKTYYPHLGECKNYQRLLQPHSLYYTNGLRTLLFYDKIEEGRVKKVQIPEVWMGQNVLRYEARFLKRLPSQFNRNEILGSTLFEEKFYMNLIDRWEKEFITINKLKKINFNMEETSSPKEFWRVLKLKAIDTIGQDQIMQEIENLRLNNAFKKAEYYSRLKSEVKSLCNDANLTSSSDLIEELDQRIKQSNKYYR